MRSRLSGQCSCKLELPPWPRENHGLRHPTVGACGFPEACRESCTLLEGDRMDRASLLCAQHPPALTPLGLEARPVLPVTGESSQGTPAPTWR